MNKLNRKILSLILTLVLAVSAVVVFPEAAYASADDMRLYSIYLKKNSGESVPSGDEKEYGDAVLMESAGEYLLMDTGAPYVSNSVIKYLKKVLPSGATLNIYISHLHKDHYGALADIIDAGIKIGTVYLPDRKTIGKDYISSETGADLDAVIRTYIYGAGVSEDQVVWLKKGSAFTLGTVKAKVLGPVGSYKMSDFRDGGEYGTKREGHYMNNYSLTTMFTTAGGVKFLTTGDIEEKEEKALVKKCEAGSIKLKADILKLAHHGLKSSNSEGFIKKVKPTYAFAENMGYSDSTKVDGNTVQRFNTPVKYVQKYGMQYMVAHEKASLGIRVTGKKIMLYRDSNNNGTLASDEKLVKWVSVAGISPKSQKNFTGKDNFYIDSKTYKPKTGVQKIGKKYYLFTSGGAMQKAYYKNGTTYRYWRSYGNRLRRFSKPNKYGRSYMYVGVKKVSGNYFFFEPKTGYRFKASKGTGGTQFKKVKYGKYYYAVNIKTGYVKRSCTIKLGKTTYKADKKGHLKKV